MCWNVLQRRCSAVLMIMMLSAFGLQAARAQATATNICKDGTTTASTGRGACSGHGGVDKTATKAAQAPANSKASTTPVTCTDGTTSKPGRGACSHHGGVAGATARTSARVTSPVAPAQVPRQASARTPNEAKSEVSRAGSGGGEDNNPSGAIAQCKDGMYSHAKQRRGACSRHGGVAKWLAT